MKSRDLTPATKSDISDVRDELKTDISNLRVVLKTDIANLRTELKTDISDLRAELKEDNRTTRHDLALEIVRTQNDLSEVKATMATKADVGKILGAIDSFAGQMTDMQRAVVLRGQILTEVQVTLADHGQRITALERC